MRTEFKVSESGENGSEHTLTWDTPANLNDPRWKALGYSPAYLHRRALASARITVQNALRSRAKTYRKKGWDTGKIRAALQADLDAWTYGGGFGGSGQNVITAADVARLGLSAEQISGLGLRVLGEPEPEPDEDPEDEEA